MIETLFSDGAILILACVGLVVTGLSIVSDTRSQQRRAAMRRLAVVEEDSQSVRVAA